ncbi:MAG: hypothetical protein PHO66_05160 [Eubacteriales bacterium]|nr:hypothetical protein [Eubacteriales bacterium]
MSNQPTQPCAGGEQPNSACETCRHACPMAGAMADAPVDWKVWALLAVGVVAAAVIVKLLL